MRNAVSFAAATLVAYVGIVHEVVGAKLYPAGPSDVGGPLVWHSLGIAGVAAGALLAAGTFRLIPIPTRPLAAVVGFLGGIIVVIEALTHGGFHFFAFTLVVAGGVLVATE